MNLKEQLSLAAKKYKANKQKAKSLSDEKPREAMAAFLSARYYKNKTPKNPDRVKARSGIRDWQEKLGELLIEGSMGIKRLLRKQPDAANDVKFLHKLLKKNSKKRKFYQSFDETPGHPTHAKVKKETK